NDQGSPTGSLQSSEFRRAVTELDAWTASSTGSVVHAELLNLKMGFVFICSQVGGKAYWKEPNNLVLLLLTEDEVISTLIKVCHC
uniref:Uncharacterized protein n=1 Tax=Podarcis muralis TaxID=64176 RepID=A0A670J816_PODMU